MQKSTPPVVKLDSFEVAQMVIRSVRCISHGKTNYQSCDRNHALLSSKDLNVIIHQKKSEYDNYSEKKEHVDNLLNISNHGSSGNALRYFEEQATENSKEQDIYSSSDDERIPKSQRKGNLSNLPPRSLEKSVQHNSDDEIFLNNDDDEDNELFKHFIPPSKDGKISGSVEFSSDRKSKASSGDVALSSVKKGIIIKPGQAIRVNPVKKTKK